MINYSKEDFSDIRCLIDFLEKLKHKDQLLFALFCTEYYWLFNEKIDLSSIKSQQMKLQDGYDLLMVALHGSDSTIHAALSAQSSSDPEKCKDLAKTFIVRTDYKNNSWNNFIND